MPRVSFAFFTLAALSGLTGTIWGSRMGESGDHTTFIAHAHFNLLGWVGMALMGTFYALAVGRYPGWLAWTNLALQAIGAVALSGAMILLFAIGDQRGGPMVIVGSLSSILSMAALLLAVLLAWRNTARQAR